MGRYGYLDCEEGYSDVADWKVEATCAHCGKEVTAIRESCWEENSKLVTECGCTEYDDELAEEDLGNWETGLPEWDLLED